MKALSEVIQAQGIPAVYSHRRIDGGAVSLYSVMKASHLSYHGILMTAGSLISPKEVANTLKNTNFPLIIPSVFSPTSECPSLVFE